MYLVFRDGQKLASFVLEDRSHLLTGSPNVPCDPADPTSWGLYVTRCSCMVTWMKT